MSREQWHCRLGHPASPIIQHILCRHDLPSEHLHNNAVCDACQQGKSHQLPFSLSTRATSKPLQIIYSDVWGPAQVSTSGHKYYVSFVDAFSRFTWIYFLKHKSEVFQVFLQFQRHVERLLNHKILFVQTDWGGEYHKLNVFFQNIGIAHRVSCPHTHQRNGIAERKHRHIVETGLTLLTHASVPFRFWHDAFSTACFVINRLPSRVIHMQTPLERLLGEVPDYTFFKVFGRAWPHLRPYNHRKLEFRSKKCVFLGYSSIHKGYKCLHVPSNRMYISRDVVFDETIFPFSNLPSVTPQPSSTSTSLPMAGQFGDIAYSPLLVANHGAGPGRGARLVPLDDDNGADHGDCSPPATPGRAAPASPMPSAASLTQASASPAPSTATAPASPAAAPPPEPPSPPAAAHRPVTRLQRGIRQIKERTDGTVTYLATTCMARAHADPESEPTDHRQALHHAHWKEAMESEFSALLKNDTWQLVPPRSGVNIIDSKWVFKIKKTC